MKKRSKRYMAIKKEKSIDSTNLAFAKLFTTSIVFSTDSGFLSFVDVTKFLYLFELFPIYFFTICLK